LKDRVEQDKTTVVTDASGSFYLRDPSTVDRDPLLLVPSIQFFRFLKTVSNQTGEELDIPQGQVQADFFITFGQLETPVPRFLGRADSENALNILRDQIYSLPTSNVGILPGPALQCYVKKMEGIYATIKSQKGNQNHRNMMLRRIERQKSYGRQTKRVQRYLGLRCRSTDVARKIPWCPHSIRY
jgi:hypothetical protein